ncbi:MAG: protein kinase [Gemmatimonadales bacterium]
MSDVLSRLATALESQYRIVEQIGIGGMATVYLAEDVRHHRNVAIKVLHPELSAVLGSERFLKEIELTANLQHPHILPLFDSGSADGLLFYVMPFIEGETLRGRLSREHQLPIPSAVRIAVEVADALEYAHKRGVIHRDIKPENILLHDGRPLVADFGIALAVQQASGERMTQTGMSLGTPQYMAPEQAMGDKAVDHRTDIYALGAVAYEMIAGDPPFTGPTAQAIVAKVMTEKPRPLGELRDTVPRNVAAAIHAALRKFPADRPGSAAEFGSALTASSADRSVDDTSAWREWNANQMVGAAVALFLFGAVTGYLLATRLAQNRVSSAVPSRLAIMAPALGGTGPAGLNRQIAITPDGTAVVYVAITPDGTNGLAYQGLDAGEPIMIPETDGMLNPLISPDGRSVIGGGGSLFRSEFTYKRVPISGGVPADMPKGPRLTHAFWGQNGDLWYESTGNGELAVLLANGKVVEKLVGKGRGLVFQQLLSDGRTALMTRTPFGTSSGPCVLVDVDTGAESPLINVPIVEARYGNGYLVYVEPNATMWAAPFDEKAKRMTGTAVELAGSVSLSGSGMAQFAMATTGTVAYIPEEPRSLVFADREGSFRLATSERHSFHAPQFSRDGRRVSVDFTAGDARDVWILSPAQRILSRATFDRDGHDATWAPDGQSIAYTTFKNNSVFGVYRIRPGSSGKADSLIVSPKLGYTGVWLPDGSGLVTSADNLVNGSGRDIALVGGGGRGPITPLIATPFQTQYPVVSPDGHWLAFVSDQSGAEEVYVRPFAGTGEDVQVSQNGGTEPVWGPDGRELFYRGGTEGRVDLMSASVTTSAGFDVTSRRALFPVTDIVVANPHANYDISPDGRTFVMVRRSPATRIVVLQNLPELVKRIRDADVRAR